jgi:transcriptional regulator with XRE-family HTH domain
VAGSLHSRTYGLRREEVAALAGVSIDYYTRLEQGRDRRPSLPVLNAISLALGLSPDEQAHLFRLVGLLPPTSALPAPDEVRASTRALVDALQPVPAYLLSVAMDIVAWNPAAAALFTDFDVLAPQERNILWLSFVHPALRERWLDWETAAAELLATLRAGLGRHPGQSRIIQLIGRLSTVSAEFAERWDRYDVAAQCGMTRRLRHPAAGELTVVCEQLTVPPVDQRLISFHPADLVSTSRLAELTARGPRVSPLQYADGP